MSEQYDVQGEQRTGEERPSIRRRGLIAGAAALIAGVLAKQAAEPVAAGIDGDITINALNTSGATTAITSSFLSTSPAFVGSNNFPIPGSLDFHGDGIQGYTTNPDPTKSNAGVFGRVNDLNGVGTWGEAPNGTGAFGDSSSGSGVAGNSSTGVGVYGKSANSYGVQGISSHLHGVYAEAGDSAGAGALVGVTRVSSGVAFQGIAVAPAVQAGYFRGDVAIYGSLGVSGGKFAIVKGADQKYHGMYAVEAPEPWFEDFGTGTLTNGKAVVNLDPLFTHHIHTNDYHVFITEHDEHNALHVVNRAGKGFEVHADAATAHTKGKALTAVSGTFSWRVIAKRNDIKGERLPVWELPSEPVIPATTPMPNLPKTRPSKP